MTKIKPFMNNSALVVQELEVSLNIGVRFVGLLK
jgi:hypothetical protein